MESEINIVVCGHGHDAIALAATLLKNTDFDAKVSLLELANNKVTKDCAVIWPDNSKTELTDCYISDQVQKLIPYANIIFIVHSANALPEIIKIISPFFTDQLKFLCGMLSPCGFDLIVDKFVANKDLNFAIGATASLPFIAKFVDSEYKNVNILEHKKELHIAVSCPKPLFDQYPLTKLLGIPIIPAANFLTLALINSAARINPILMMNYEDNHNSTFYSISNRMFTLLQAVESELLKLRNLITAKGVDLGYKTLETPMLDDTGKVLSDLCLLEDISCGLMFLKGLAELYELDTPSINSVIVWAQEKLSVKYLISERINKALLDVSLTPQRFGIDTVSKLTRNYIKHSSSLDHEVEEFQKNGAVFIGKVLPQAYFEEINDKITKVLQETIVAESLLNLHDKEQWVADLCSRPEFTEIAKAVLKDDSVLIFSSMILVKPANAKLLVPWHQDAAYDWPLDPIECVSFWLALDDATVENGAMKFALGGHKKKYPLAPTKPFENDEYCFSTQLVRSIPIEELRDTQIVDCNMKKGECSLHHSMMPHSSGPNNTNQRRCAFIVRYCKSNAKLVRYPGMPREEYFANFSLIKPTPNSL